MMRQLRVYDVLHDKFLSLVDGKEDKMVDSIEMTRVISCEDVACAIQDVLGVDVDESTFNWERDVLSEFAFYLFRVGVTTIFITKSKSLMGLLCEIMAAMLDGINVKRQISIYPSYISNDGFAMSYEFDYEYLNQMDIKELVNWINEDQYCDSKMAEDTITKLGYKICEGEHPEFGLCKYIDTSMYRDESKIWLYVGINQHTLYREVKPRLLVEVLYLLNALHFGENIFSDEY